MAMQLIYDIMFLLTIKKIFGLNSHGNHILLQDLLTLAMRRVLPKEVSELVLF
jgi:hypothetical protein